VTRVFRLALGTAATVAVVTGAAALSAWPGYRSVPADSALMKLSFSHGGARNCRELTAEELARLPRNMRRTEVCERERLPVHVVLDIDGATAFEAELPPSGLAGDGPSRVYETFVLPAGPHAISVHLRDSARAEGYDHMAERRVELAAGQNFVIDFDPAAGGFVFE